MSTLDYDGLIKTLGQLVFEKMLTILPRWLARYLISPRKIARKIEVDLRSSNPIDITFATEIPSLSLYFRITNLSPANLLLDRLLINLWIGQPTLEGAILERHEVPSGNSNENISFTSQLTIPQQEQIKKKVKEQRLFVPVTIYIKAYFDSKVGLVFVEKKLELREVLVNGLTSAPS